MNGRRFACVLLAAMTSAGFGATVAAQEGGSGEMDTQAMMEAYEAASQPGPMHEMLMKGVGMWHVTGNAMAPNGEMQEWHGTIKRTPMFGGRYLQEEWTIDDMAGVSFKGFGLTGYNNATEQFESIWIDSMSTGMFMQTGTHNEETDSLEMSGEMVDPLMGPMAMRSVSKWTDDNSFTFEMFMTGPDGTEMSTMKATATRGEGDMHRNTEHGKSGDAKGKAEESKGKSKGGKGGE